MYKYRLVEQEEKVSKFHQERVDAFDKIEARLDNIKKSLRQAKIETIKYYRENPSSFVVVKPTDLINDYLNDIEILLEKE
jgi:dsDNA-binding SOS-regulon protein|tara:strand:- start:844 stop:1083 length:240 start_codon:yes stop_codon:yes gene_type:complete